MTKGASWPGLVALLILAAIVAAAAALTWQQTAAEIALNERNYRLRVLHEIVPAERYDNSLFDDTTQALDPELLGSEEPVTVYRARSNGMPVALIMRVVAPQGYSGAIQLLVGINHDGTVAGVRAVEHRETPGLGDQIDTRRSNWILTFDGKALGNPPVQEWAVKSDGGKFDQFTGATITPRAVVRAVRDALLYFQANREQLFAETPST
ncbi:MAG: electron transport complex subunit RsxG [Gammaproteobacteria bacterium]|nr:electron transport complex subunit RsxG [Gammaproteobacteria bacterium]NNF60243.1 electron transport complex subunit RsxG [Gammaproteobacteria bacterium]NNM20351.1 electron transport complex subunit RsxG [Gammaproteobacteria bacterium]